MKAVGVRPRQPDGARLLRVEPPPRGAHEVLVEVRLVGLDGTDAEIVAGRHGEPPEGEEVLIIGHESLGKVVEGGEAAGLGVGDPVVATVRRPGECPNCQAGEQDMCLAGGYSERGIKGRHGYLAEYYAEETQYLVAVPERLGDAAVLLEPTAVAEKAIRQAYSVGRRISAWQPRTAMVTGTGPLGLLTAILLRLRRLEVISVDRSDDQRKAAIFSRLGVTHFNLRRLNLHEIPARIGTQLDLIFEATGSSSVALHAMSVVGTNGVVVLTSITGGERRLEVCADCLNQGLVLGNKAVVGSVSAHRQDFEQGIGDLLAARSAGLAG